MDGIPSPFWPQEGRAIEQFKQKLLEHLDFLRMPQPAEENHHAKDCARECHLIERNHTLAVVKSFIRTH